MPEPLSSCIGCFAARPGLPLSAVAFGLPMGDTAQTVGSLILIATLVFTLVFYRRMVRVARHAKEQLRELFEAAPFAIGVTDRTTGKFVFANRHLVQLLSLAPDAYRAQRVPYLHPERDRARMLEALAANGLVRDMEMELVASDGRRLHILGSVAPFAFGGVEALIGTFQDITPLKEAELKLRASEARLLALFQTVPDGIVVLTTDGIIRQVSDSCAQMIGDTEPGHHLGKPILSYVPESDRPIAAALLQKLIAHEPREIVSYRIRRLDGTEIWVEPKGVVITDPVSRERLVILVVRNITKRREAEIALATHAAKLQEALARITHLQNEFLRVCAWTKQVNIDGQWMPIDHYLAKHLGFKLTHGMSEAGAALFGLSPDDLKAPPPGTAPQPPPPDDPTAT